VEINMRAKWLWVILAAVVVLAIHNLTAYGGTPCAHFTGNRHDTLLIGEIIESSEDTITIKSTGFIVSAGARHQDGDGNYTRTQREINRMLRREAARQLRPEIAVVYKTHPAWWGPSWTELNVGDYVIASLNRDQYHDGFVVAWGIFTVSSLDYKTLQVDARCFVGSYDFYTEFVNSRGYGGYFILVGERPPRWWARFFS